jgi:hypothetical protein
MTRILFVFLFTATLAITAISQNQNQPENTPVCNLSLSQAPAIRGIRLGMKPDEWLKLFPVSAQDERIKAILDQPPAYPSYGRNSITFESTSASGHTGTPFRILFGKELSGIDRVTLELFDNQIIALQIAYAPYPCVSPWDDVAQLIPIFSETFNLPQDSAWEKNGGVAELKCAGFVLRLVTGNAPSVYLTSKLNFDQIIRQRREADKQKGRAAFRP